MTSRLEEYLFLFQADAAIKNIEDKMIFWDLNIAKNVHNNYNLSTGFKG